MSKHQKAISAPKTFPIKRKEGGWTIKPSPGPHPADDCVPLAILIRDILGAAESVKEVKKILHQGKCKVDGRVVKDHRFPVGTFDSINLGDESYRIVPSKRGFKLLEIDEDESKKKLSRIEDKTIIKGGQTQINLEDGKNIIVDQDFDMETGSAVLLQLPEYEILDGAEPKQGCKVMITKGKNRGRIAELKEKKEVKGSKPNRVIVTVEDEEIDLPEDLIFPLGEEGNMIEVE
jgi:small subunit ribosomal protein S4e